MSKKVFVSWPTITNEMNNEVIRVLNEEKLVGGESVSKFEEEFANFIGVDFAVAVSSGTNALSMIMEGLNIRNEVITTPSSFIATSNSIINSGATPVFSDIELSSGLIDPSQIPKQISNKSQAIMPVHLYGFPVEMDAIGDIAQEHNLTVIEDACQAHGARIDRKRVGSLGEAAAFSFYSTKNMTVGGDGGMITTNNENLAKKIAKMRDGGRVEGEKHLHDEKGYTSRLNSINAAIGRIQLKNLPKWNEIRRGIASNYNKELDELAEVKILKPLTNTDPVYHLYPILIDNRDEYVKYMNSNGIEIGINYPNAIPDQPYYQNLKNIQGSWDNARHLAGRIANLPMHPNLESDDVNRIIEHTKSFINQKT